MERFHSRLSEHFRAYKARHLPDVPDGVLHHNGVPLEYPHILPKERFDLNILPSIRAPFWRWFESQHGNIKLHHFFHHLNSSQALCFNLLFPFLADDGKTVDVRLLRALAIDSKSAFSGQFETVLGKDENTNFDFYLEAESGRKVFCELNFSETEFGSCEDDERHRVELELHYRPYLQGHIDAHWFDGKTFFENYQILRSVSYLARDPDSTLFFIFPEANESLRRSEETIAKVAADALGRRVMILHLEVLLERVRALIGDEPALLDHFDQFTEKYVVTTL